MTIIKDGTVGINTISPSSSYKLDVNGESRFRNFITLDDAGDNSGTGLYFLGATGGSDGSGGYLSNFRVGNSLVGNDIFEITANDGTQGATTWKATPALSIQGTNNRVGINTTSFSGQDNTDPNNIITRFYALNIEGNFNINNGNLFVDNKPFVTSRWTEATTNIVDPNVKDIYRLSAVGINKVDPDYTLDVDGDFNLTGAFRVNGTAQWLDADGIIRVTNSTITQNVTIPANTIAYSRSPVYQAVGVVITIEQGATWTISD